MRRNNAKRGGDLVQIAGATLFGLASLATYLPVALLSEPEFAWGPGFMTLVAFALLFLHVALIWRRTLPLDPAIWLPVAVIFFYFGVPIAVEGAGRGLGFSYDPWQVGPPYNIARGYCAALLAFAAFVLGIHLAGVKDLSKLTASASADSSLALPSLVLVVGALAMMTIGIILVGPSVVFGTYEEWWGAKKAGADARFVDVGIVLAQAGMFALIASHHPKRPYRLYLAVFVAVILSYVAIQKGARASLMATGVGLVWCSGQRVKRLNAFVVTGVALMGVLAFPILGEYRVTKRIGGLEDQTFRELFATSMMHMGSTVNTLLYTIDLVPQAESYANGVGYVEAVYQAIPNLGLTPSRGDSITGTLKAYHSNWVTWQVSPLWAASGGGYGSSMAGELYFNFGLPGILIGCALVGFVSGRLRSAAQESALMLTASALYFGSMIIYVRNPIGVPLKNFVWSVIALLVLRTVFSLLTRRTTSAGVSRPAPL